MSMVINNLLIFLGSSAQDHQLKTLTQMINAILDLECKVEQMDDFSIVVIFPNGTKITDKQQIAIEVVSEFWYDSYDEDSWIGIDFKW